MKSMFCCLTRTEAEVEAREVLGDRFDPMLPGSKMKMLILGLFMAMANISFDDFGRQQNFSTIIIRHRSLLQDGISYFSG
ncbi:MAG: hypothetical protein U0T81_10275 [Saprospiraceae bacterium]